MGAYVADICPSVLKRIGRKEEAAFADLFRRFRLKVFYTAVKILKEESAAEDALQETFLKIYRGACSFRGEAKIGTWIHRITVNVCLEMLRRNKWHRQRVREDIADHGDLADPKLKEPYEEALRSEIEACVQAALSRLSEKHRRAVTLHDLNGYTLKEISRLTRLPLGTVKSRVFYGREKLKQQLQNSPLKNDEHSQAARTSHRVIPLRR